MISEITKLVSLDVKALFTNVSVEVATGPRLRNFDWGGGQVDGHTPIGGGQSDGHAFIIKLKFCHVKRFILVLV